MIVARGGKDQYPKVWAFNTFFYTFYRDNGYQNIRGWSKKIDIFDHDIIFIPVRLIFHDIIDVMFFTQPFLILIFYFL